MSRGPDVKWSAAKVARLRALIDQRVPTAKIAIEFGISRDSVLGKCRREGIKLKRGPSVASPRETDWPADRVARLRKLLGTGSTAAEAASELGVSRNAVIGKAYRTGIAFASRTSVKAAGSARG
jgi:hypothetical protein